MASNDIKVVLRGSREVRRALKKAGERGREHLEEALNAGAEVVLQAAKQNAPVRTGWLRDHLAIKTAFDDDKGVVVLVGGNPQQDGRSGNLAYWQEFGTSKQPARPFLRPAFDTSKLAAQAAIVATLRRKLGL